ncbi:MAG: alpha/beta hydrolase [Beijerinckiaceae bacterium]|nr:alpha/beta hydrolase [Beijerinckiaceae bacterium]
MDAASAPLVWRNYHQAALDAAYDQAQYAPNQADTKARRMVMSGIALERLGAPDVIPYGAGANERFDLYRASGRDRLLVVYVHGGAWRNGAARDFAFLAELFVDSGAHFAALDFDQIDDCAGDLLPMADQVRRGVAHLAAHAALYGADPARIHVIGHSSGAHLAGCVVTTDWAGAFGLSPHLLRGGLLCSGMYDLEPVRLSARSRYVAFTDAIEERLSPMRHIAQVRCPLILAHGTLETPEFQRQTRDFAAALEAAKKPVELIVATGFNHFEILETLASPYGLLGRAALKMIGLSRG